MALPLLLAAQFGLSALQGLQQRKQLQEQNVAENSAIIEANRKNTQRVGYQTGLLRVQRAQQVKALNQRRADLSQFELSALSQAVNNAAASGTVGASVDAVQMDVQKQVEKERAKIQEENEVGAYNFNVELESLLQSGRDAIQQGVRSKAPSKASIFLGAAANTFAGYAQAKMNLGLGQPA